jgi:hypothetical protein
VARSGCCRELLAAIETWLGSRGCKSITLDTTLPLKAAMKFYEKNGYHRSGHIADFHGMPLLEYVQYLYPHNDPLGPRALCWPADGPIQERSTGV